MGATQRGTLALFIEPTANQGRQLLLPETAIGTLSITTQPNAVLAGCHMHLYIIVRGATASGTVTIAGKKNDGVTAVSETTPTMAAATSTLPEAVYCTSATYNTINSNGITVGGSNLTNATITIWGIYQGTKLVPCSFETKEKFDYHDPKDQRGLMYGTTRLTQQVKHVTLDKFDTDSFYPDTDTWYGFSVWNNTPTVTTIPASPTTKMASTAVSGAPFSLTTQPVSPGEMLQFVVTSTAVYGTIGISGTNQYGQAVTETVVCYGGAGTFYSANVYSAVASSGVTITGLTGGSLAIGGFFGTQWVFNIGSANLNTLAFAMFSGTDSAIYPYGFIESSDLEMDAQKEIKLACKCMTQDMIPLGNRTTTLLSSSRLPTLGQPFDMPTVGWQSLIYIDALSGTAFTTAYNDLQTAKISVPTGWKPTFTSTNSQLYSRAYQDGSNIKVKFDALVDFTDLNQYELWRQNTKQLIGMKFINKQTGYIGNTSGTLNYKMWQFLFPAKYDTFERDRSKEKVEAKVSGIAEYEPSLGYAAQLTIVNQASPSYQTT